MTKQLGRCSVEASGFVRSNSALIRGASWAIDAFPEGEQFCLRTVMFCLAEVGSVPDHVPRKWDDYSAELAKIEKAVVSVAGYPVSLLKATPEQLRKLTEARRGKSPASGKKPYLSNSSGVLRARKQ